PKGTHDAEQDAGLPVPHSGHRCRHQPNPGSECRPWSPAVPHWSGLSDPCQGDGQADQVG
ncbi:hypothetical protein, partial [Bacillus cereus group sp. BC327]|uniref:hypothetical protein n=1 Tax=Bacillus cereus group sp. BC327 TaxID=3445309 RepID=UPI003F20ED13